MKKVLSILVMVLFSVSAVSAFASPMDLDKDDLLVSPHPSAYQNPFETLSEDTRENIRQILRCGDWALKHGYIWGPFYKGVKMAMEAALAEAEAAESAYVPLIPVMEENYEALVSKKETEEVSDVIIQSAEIDGAGNYKEYRVSLSGDTLTVIESTRFTDGREEASVETYDINSEEGIRILNGVGVRRYQPLTDAEKNFWNVGTASAIEGSKEYERKKKVWESIQLDVVERSRAENSQSGFIIEKKRITPQSEMVDRFKKYRNHLPTPGEMIEEANYWMNKTKTSAAHRRAIQGVMDARDYVKTKKLDRSIDQWMRARSAERAEQLRLGETKSEVNLDGEDTLRRIMEQRINLEELSKQEKTQSQNQYQEVEKVIDVQSYRKAMKQMQQLMQEHLESRPTE